MTDGERRGVIDAMNRIVAMLEDSGDASPCEACGIARGVKSLLEGIEGKDSEHTSFVPPPPVDLIG